VQRLDVGLNRDAVTELLTSARVHSTIYCRTELRSPWAFGVRAADVSVFHLISDGSSWLEVDGVDEPVRLDVGDVVLLTTGRGHRLSDDPSSKTEWLDDILERSPPDEGRLSYGGGGSRTEMICGCFHLEGAPANPLLLSLPPLLHLQGSDPRVNEWLNAVLAILRLEADEYMPGGDAILARLTDLLIAQVIRTFLVSLAEADHWHVAALRDPRIAKAIRLFHSDPAQPWTVEDMAAEVAMSRSAFASVFRQHTGESPMRYLTRCRLARAASHLATDDLTVFAIAQQVGYGSEVSLTKAFTRTFGMAPGAYRRKHRHRGDHRGDGESIRSIPEIIVATDGESGR
jgi:AraC-like DNA-binding protein